jgi:glucuronate isomerase
MRLSGVPEEVITGRKDPYGCFLAYVKSLEGAIGNPLYHWSHLELKRCFQIDDIIKEDNAEIIWNKANKFIKDNAYSPRYAIAQFNVNTVVTTEEIFSDLKYHNLLKKENFKKMLSEIFFFKICII